MFVFCVLEQLFEIMKQGVYEILKALLLNIFYYRLFIVWKRNVYVGVLLEGRARKTGKQTVGSVLLSSAKEAREPGVSLQVGCERYQSSRESGSFRRRAATGIKSHDDGVRRDRRRMT